MLKIAYFINQYPKVSHTFIRREILALERQRYEVHRIALRGWKESLPDEEDRAEQRKTTYILRCGLARIALSTLRCVSRSPRRFLAALRLAFTMSQDSERSTFYHLVYLAEACHLLLCLKTSKAIHVHAHFGTNSAEVVMLARLLGGPPYSFTVHGPDEFLRPYGLKEKIQHCSFAVAISSFGRSQLYMRTNMEDWPKIHVVRCGLEPNFFQPVAPDAQETTRMICVGRLCEAKGQLLLLEAVARLLRRGLRIELVLAGDGHFRRTLEDSIKRLGIGSSVRITGWISSSRVREEILAARALVLPSFAEGLPVVIMEALALRRPVISTYVAGIPELVKSDANGWLVPAGSIDDLERVIEECLQTPQSVLREMGDDGHHAVVSRHSIDTEAASLARLFTVSNPR